jgi:hypothetical protein
VHSGTAIVIQMSPRSYPTALPDWLLIKALIGHLFGTAMTLVVLFTFGWLASFALNQLHRTHPFPADMLALLEKIELGLIHLDAAVSAVVLTAGAVRFCKSILR